jgi:ligand-binding sensor domain-containing protein
VARFDGKAWRMVSDSEDAVVATRGLARDAAGGLWVATAKGLRHLSAADAAAGRAGDLVLAGDMHDVRLDGLGRVWALSSSSIALIDPSKR